MLAAAARVLRRHCVPLVVATPRASDYLLDGGGISGSTTDALGLGLSDYSASIGQQPDNIFSAVPNTAAVARATIAVARGIQSSSVRIVGSGLRTVRTAERAARQLGLKIASIDHWGLLNAAATSAPAVAEAEADALIDELPDLSVVALLMEPQELSIFMNRAVRKASDKRITYLLGCVSGSVSASAAAQWALDLSSSAFLVEPHLLELAGLSDYLQSHGIEPHPLDNQVRPPSSLFYVIHLTRFLTRFFFFRFRTLCKQFPHWAPLSICKNCPVASSRISRRRNLLLLMTTAAAAAAATSLNATGIS